MSSKMWKQGMGMVVVGAVLIGGTGCGLVVGLDEVYTEKDGGGGNLGMGGAGGGSSSAGGMGSAGGSPECKMDGDCGVSVPACETAQCSQGACVRTYEPDGKLVPNQVMGDCASEVCDGAGKTKLVADTLDVQDDGKICTEDTCNGMTPVHTNKESVACYEGAAGTMGVGICKGGIQQCDAQGNPMGECVGDVLPGVESCILGTDEDCDGMANEEGAGCGCVPGSFADCYSGPPLSLGIGICHKGQKVCNADGLGYGGCIGEQVPQVEYCDLMNVDEDCDGASNEEGMFCVCGDGYTSVGEECDDGNQDSTDMCTVGCKQAKCGDGFVQMGNGEDCDDGNLDSSDLCTAVCMNAACGDGFVQMGNGEDCDDGGTADGDKCSPVCALQEVLMVGLGYSHSCALLSGGKVKCWGYNNYGQLGLGDTVYRGDGPGEMGANLPFVDLGTGMVATAIAVGTYHSCALLNNGTVKCWGANYAGQLGLGDTNGRGDGLGEMGDNLPSVDLGVGVTATAIGAGGEHTCALLNNGNLKCWGDNYYGQLGLGDTINRGTQAGQMGDNLPVVNLGLNLSATAIAAGAEHTCARLNNGNVKCWGHNVYGQLGLGHTSTRGNQPSEMGDNLPFVDLGMGMTTTVIAAGGYHTCARLNNGTVKCWGHNGYGQLGLGDTSWRGIQPGQMGSNLLPVNLGTGMTATTFALAFYHSCALLNNGTVKCWGFNGTGQLGLGDTMNRGDQPGQMGDNLPGFELGTGLTATAIAAGAGHTCTILSTGALKCWGYNGYGELGLGDTMNRGDQPNEMGDNLPTVKLFSDLW